MVGTVVGLLGDPRMGERHGTFVGYIGWWPGADDAAPPAAPEGGKEVVENGLEMVELWWKIVKIRH